MQAAIVQLWVDNLRFPASSNLRLPLLPAEQLPCLVPEIIAAPGSADLVVACEVLVYMPTVEMVELKAQATEAQLAEARGSPSSSVWRS